MFPWYNEGNSLNEKGGFMKKTLYYTLKIGLGVYIALVIANFLEISHPISVAIITILSVKETRKKSVIVSIRRLIAGNIAILLAFIIFYLVGFQLISLVLVLMIFIPIAYRINAKESIISGFVLTSHIYAFKYLSVNIYLEENLILILGILTGFFLIIHMPNTEKKLKQHKNEIENAFKKVMLDMSYNLRNLCFLQDQVDLNQLEKRIKSAKALSYKHRDNLFFDNEWYYIDYFQMRLIQLYRLMYMKNHFRGIFITQEQAVPLSEMTEHIASIIGTEPSVDTLLETIEDLRVHFKEEPLPKSRLEFENRSVLFQYLNDLEEFVLIKKRYLKDQKSGK